MNSEYTASTFGALSPFRLNSSNFDVELKSRAHSDPSTCATLEHRMQCVCIVDTVCPQCKYDFVLESRIFIRIARELYTNYYVIIGTEIAHRALALETNSTSCHAYNGYKLRVSPVGT